eukprot:CAMPEP_0171198152 /NCGR_PEP_ID=MMETSP0790-20130122/22781_1 /TAXON_ID=2925 /ORGANISM="Alexandrium catenella, Strain OF101" /LENGTH=112 /DNA_ID=CAMNT_0011663419 /DNA_START=43 /DNA_END=380 /DNA_ORIENTATION=-
MATPVPATSRRGSQSGLVVGVHLVRVVVAVPLGPVPPVVPVVPAVARVVGVALVRVVVQVLLAVAPAVPARRRGGAALAGFHGLAAKAEGAVEERRGKTVALAWALSDNGLE